MTRIGHGGDARTGPAAMARGPAAGAVARLPAALPLSIHPPASEDLDA
ncbi:MAG: hypothetical protein KatS3mg119_1511 [Rhodothalassiaceae bacterium]|nr:MAG: hypothetical protein KatS3mg119_1511 [Rhodothalassiaceae bacterium]